jgi:type IV pilus assembly protein PilM
MALPFLSNGRKRDTVIAIDLGGRTTKAVQMQQRSGKYVLTGYGVVEAPPAERGRSVEVLVDHFKSVVQAIKGTARHVTVALDVNSALVRHTEMPLLPVGDLRQILRNNSKTYLQQDLPNYIYDCFIAPLRTSQKIPEAPKPPGPPKMRVLVAGARQDLVGQVQAAVKGAGMTAESVVPGLIGPANAFELAMPEVFSREAVALVDMGFHNTSICLLADGELVLSRVVSIGGDRLTSGLAEAMGISYGEAEGIKIGIPNEVQSSLEPLIVPLGRELRASIDCFEHQQDRPITQVYVSGGSARSDLIVQALQAELMLECKVWNPLSFAELALPPQQVADFEAAAPQLTVAVGAALATL